MAAKRRSKIKSPAIIFFILILMAVCACIYFFGDKIGIELFKNEEEKPTVNAPVINGEDAYFHFIDVGQADAILVMTKDGNMLVDSGDLSPS